MPTLTQGPMTEFQILLVMGIAVYLTVGPLVVAAAALAGYIGRRREMVSDVQEVEAAEVSKNCQLDATAHRAVAA